MTRYVGLDLSTKTGIVVLDEQGSILRQSEVKKTIKENPGDMYDLILDVTKLVGPEDVVVMEGFGFASKTGFLLGGIGWGVRMELWKRNIPYYLAAPTALKKFATGSGVADKRKLAVAVNNKWGFFDDSDNVTDAYILAQMARAIGGHEKINKVQQTVLKKVTKVSE
ncbi:hypothetical protein P4639_14430 [Priestia megaterium]|uniref:hypothetical protein n=1 Tax=Priestia megaterium TaxID=1404 RepID=UPI002E220B6F|nr:hypothetical protein [Priestia megaterium]